MCVACIAALFAALPSAAAERDAMRFCMCRICDTYVGLKARE
jgi:hypothetical protein